MLRSLHIENIALIDTLDIELENRLNVMSGETGAGKSIIVDSLSFVLGERADKTLIKHGSEKAFVEVVFEIDESDKCYAKLSDLGYQPSTTVVITRSLTMSGKNECRVNSRVTSTGVLREITGTLVDVFGQSQHQNLYRPETHIEVLDNFDYAKEYFDKLSVLYAKYRENKKLLSVFGGDESQRARTIDILKYQIDEIKAAKLSQTEEDDLITQKNRMVNGEKLAQSLATTIEILNGQANVSKLLSQSANNLSTVGNLDPEIAKLSQRLSEVGIEIDDVLESCEQIAAQVDYNPTEIDRIMERLETVKQIKRKYGGSIEKAQEFLQNAENQYDNLINATEQIQKLTDERNVILDSMYEISTKLSAHRKTAALRLQKDIETQLTDLGMSGTSFVVDFAPAPTRSDFVASSKGYDKVEFLLSANKGQPVKPLAKILSGGEMSRFMLAIKNITAKIEAIPTMVFDEIDIGISGLIAQMMAQKLSNISREYQCIVITHLPQVAAMGDCNLLITKSQNDNSTKTELTVLSEKEKVREVARLSGGDNIGEYSLLHAQELIDWASGYKQNH